VDYYGFRFSQLYEIRRFNRVPPERYPPLEVPRVYPDSHVLPTPPSRQLPTREK
jgi:hypothetical protein